jgi:hypothetical protein
MLSCSKRAMRLIAEMLFDVSQEPVGLTEAKPAARKLPDGAFRRFD